MDSGQWVNFSLTAAVGPSNASIWAAVGFSRDIYMVCVCVFVWRGGGGGRGEGGGGEDRRKREGGGGGEREGGGGLHCQSDTPIRTNENFKDK